MKSPLSSRTCQVATISSKVFDPTPEQKEGLNNQFTSLIADYF